MIFSERSHHCLIFTSTVITLHDNTFSSSQPHRYHVHLVHLSPAFGGLLSAPLVPLLNGLKMESLPVQPFVPAYFHTANCVCHPLMQRVNGHSLLSMSKCENGPQSPLAHLLRSICVLSIWRGLCMVLLWMNILEQVFCELESLLLFNENPAVLFLVMWLVYGWQC